MAYTYEDFKNRHPGFDGQLQLGPIQETYDFQQAYGDPDDPTFDTQVLDIQSTPLWNTRRQVEQSFAEQKQAYENEQAARNNEQNEFDYVNAANLTGAGNMRPGFVGPPARQLDTNNNNPQTALQDAGYLLNNFNASMEDVYAGLFGMAHADDTAKYMREYSNEVGDNHPIDMGEDFSNIVPYLTSVRGVGHDTTNLLGSMTALMPAGVIGGELGVGSKAAQLAAKVPIIKKILNIGMKGFSKLPESAQNKLAWAASYGSTKAIPESLSEGGNARLDLLENNPHGVDPTMASLETATLNYPLLAVSDMLEGATFGKGMFNIPQKYMPGFLGKTTAGKVLTAPLRSAPNMALTGVREGTEEASQTGITAAAKGDNYGVLPWDWTDEQKQAFRSTLVPGAVLGLLGGSAHAAKNDSLNKSLQQAGIIGNQADVQQNPLTNASAWNAALNTAYANANTAGNTNNPYNNRSENANALDAALIAAMDEGYSAVGNIANQANGNDIGKGNVGAEAPQPQAEAAPVPVLEATQSLMGQTMDNHDKGCVEAVTKAGALLNNDFLKNELANGVVGVTKLVEDATAAGVPVVDYDPANVQAGDIIVYGDENHVVMATGEGNGYVGNSSKKDRFVAGSDYTEMDDLAPTKIIKTGAGRTSGSTTVNTANAAQASVQLNVDDMFKGMEQENTEDLFADFANEAMAAGEKLAPDMNALLGDTQQYQNTEENRQTILENAPDLLQQFIEEQAALPDVELAKRLMSHASARGDIKTVTDIQNAINTGDKKFLKQAVGKYRSQLEQVATNFANRATETQANAEAGTNTSAPANNAAQGEQQASNGQQVVPNGQQATTNNQQKVQVAPQGTQNTSNAVNGTVGTNSSINANNATQGTSDASSDSNNELLNQLSEGLGALESEYANGNISNQEALNTLNILGESLADQNEATRANAAKLIENARKRYEAAAKAQAEANKANQVAAAQAIKAEAPATPIPQAIPAENNTEGGLLNNEGTSTQTAQTTQGGNAENQVQNNVPEQSAGQGQQEGEVAASAPQQETAEAEQAPAESKQESKSDIHWKKGTPDYTKKFGEEVYMPLKQGKITAEEAYKRIDQITDELTKGHEGDQEYLEGLHKERDSQRNFVAGVKRNLERRAEQEEKERGKYERSQEAEEYKKRYDELTYLRRTASQHISDDLRDEEYNQLRKEATEAAGEASKRQKELEAEGLPEYRPSEDNAYGQYCVGTEANGEYFVKFKKKAKYDQVFKPAKLIAAKYNGEYRKQNKDDKNQPFGFVFQSAEDANNFMMMVDAWLGNNGLSELIGETQQAPVETAETKKAANEGDKAVPVSNNPRQDENGNWVLIDGSRVELSNGYTISSGKSINDASADDFIVKPDGSLAFGHITKDVEKETNGELKAGEIRLKVGDQHSGLIHAKKHEGQLDKSKYDSIEAFIEDIASNYDSIYRKIDSKNRVSYTLVKNNPDTLNGVSPVGFKLESDGKGHYYIVITAIPKSEKSLKKQIKKEAQIYSSLRTPAAITSSSDGVSTSASDNSGTGHGAVAASNKSSASSADSNIPQNQQESKTGFEGGIANAGKYLRKKQKEVRFVNFIKDDDLDAAIDDAIAEMNGKLSANPMFNPNLYCKLFKVGAILAQRGINKLATWTSKMLDLFTSKGVEREQVEPWLSSVWAGMVAYPKNMDFNEDMLTAFAQAIGEFHNQGIIEYKDVLKAFNDEFEADDIKEYEPVIKAAYKGIYTFFDEMEGNNNEQQGKSSSADGRSGSVSAGESSGNKAERNEGPGSVSGHSGQEREGYSGSADKENTGGSEPGGVRSGAELETPASKGSSERADNESPALTEAQAHPSPTETPGHDYEIKESAAGKTSEKKRFEQNINAIKMLQQLEAENRMPTPAEQEILAAYNGWGGLKNAFVDGTQENTELKELLTDEEYKAARSTINDAFYTSPDIVRAIWEGVSRLGFKGGRVLDPSMGVGNFFGCMPRDMMKNSSLHGVELDSLTSRFSKLLYPSAYVENTGFQSAQAPDNYYDLVISNIPFGQLTIQGYKIHNYFFANGIDKVRPGGLMVFITSQGSLTNTQDAARMRNYLAGKADMIAAYKLPSGAFNEAGTGVVTDIVIVQKRGKDGVQSKYAQSFLEVKRRSAYHGYGSAPINEYFEEHPENILGESSVGKNQYGDYAINVAAKPNTTIEGELSKALAKLPENVYEAQTAAKSDTFNDTAANKKARADEKTRDLEYYIKDGKVYQNQNGEAVEVKGEKGKKVKAYVELKNQLNALMIAQWDPKATDKQLAALRKNLNKVYDAFVKKYGYLNDKKVSSAFLDDPSSGMVMALERIEKDDTGTKEKIKGVEKAAIFTERTVEPRREATKADNPGDALIASLANKGVVDLDYMAKLLGSTPKKVAASLQGKIFKNPMTNGYEPREEYLSGNVREKLAHAKAEAKKNKEYEYNVKELEKIIPEDLVSSEILVNPGAIWIPVSDIQDFVNSILSNGVLNVKYLSATGRWAFDGWGSSGKYDAKGMSFSELLESIFNNKAITIYKGDKKDKKIDQEATDAAKLQAEQLRTDFKEWLWSDKEREKRLVRYYNDNYNNYVVRQYDGSHLGDNFPGMNSKWKMHPHQSNVVWRMLQKANTLIAHCVGAGKTAEMQAAGMEMRRLGIARKPLYCLPNNVVEQFAREFRTLYPSAKILVLQTSDLPAVPKRKSVEITEDGRKKTKKIEIADMPEKERKAYLKARSERNRTLSRIQTEDWDAVIISHTMFERFPLTPTTVNGFIQEEVDVLERSKKEAKGQNMNKRAIASMEDRIKKLKEQMQEQLNTDLDDIGIPFESLGIDQLFVDEADLFKNLPFASAMDKVSGIGNPSSKRARDMFVKTQWLTRTLGGRGVVFATGTPISNTMAEMFTMMRYMDTQGLKGKGLELFDNWVRTFAEIGSDYERKPTGDGFRKVNKVLRFINMPELTSMFRKFADVKHREDLDLDVPALKNGKPTIVQIDADPYLVNYIKNVVPERLKKMSKSFKKEKGEDNMLKLTGDLRKMSMTDTKIEACAAQITRVFEETTDVKGAQLVFCDLGVPKAKSDTDTRKEDEADDSAELENASVYEKLKATLIAQGIPADQIAFVQDAKNKKQMDKLFQQVNDGNVRILIGSTQKMGAGTNCQKHLVALHHLDAPWRPRDIEQREGRIIRQGNDNKEVEIFNYVVKDSFDANMWEKLKNKAAIIAQAMSGDTTQRAVEDADLVTLSYAEVEGAATGNPLIKEQLDLNNEITKFSHAQTMLQKQQRDAQHDIEHWQRDKLSSEHDAKQIEADLKERKSTRGENFSMKIGDQVYTERTKAEEALSKLLSKFSKRSSTKIGEIGGFDLKAVYAQKGWSVFNVDTDGVVLQLVNHHAYVVKTNTVQGVENMVNKGIDSALSDAEYNVKYREGKIKEAEEVLARKDTYADKIKELQKRLSEVKREIESTLVDDNNSNESKNQQAEPEVETDPETGEIIGEGPKFSIKPDEEGVTQDKINEAYANRYTVPANELTEQERAIVEFAKDNFGLDVEIYEGESFLEGFWNPVEPNRIGINRKGVGSKSFLFWHEWTHWLRANNIELFNEMVQAIKQTAPFTRKQITDYKRRRNAPDMSDDLAIEEMIADKMERIEPCKEMLADVASNNSALVKRVIAWIQDVCRRFIDKLFNPRGGLTYRQKNALQKEFCKLAAKMKDAEGNDIFRVNYTTGTAYDANGKTLEVPEKPVDNKANIYDNDLNTFLPDEVKNFVEARVKDNLSEIDYSDIDTSVENTIMLFNRYADEFENVKSDREVIKLSNKLYLHADNDFDKHPGVPYEKFEQNKVVAVEVLRYARAYTTREIIARATGMAQGDGAKMGRGMDRLSIKKHTEERTENKKIKPSIKASINNDRSFSNAENPSIKFSISPRNDNTKQGITQMIKNRFFGHSENAKDDRQMIKGMLEDLTQCKIRWGKMLPGEDAIYKSAAKVIHSRPYDWNNLLPEVGKNIVKQLGLNQDEKLSNYIGKWLMDGQPNNTTPEAKKFAEALKEYPVLADKLRDIQDAFKSWNDKSAEERLHAVISYEPESKSIKGSFKEFTENMYDQFVEELGPVKRMVAAIEQEKQLKLPVTANPYSAFRLFRGHYGKAMTMVEGKSQKAVDALQNIFPYVDFTGFKTLHMILGDIGALNDEAKRKKFADYCVACHVKDIHERNHALEEKIKGMQDELEDAKAKVKENPDNEEAAKLVKELRNKISYAKTQFMETPVSEKDCDVALANNGKEFGQAQQDLVFFSTVITDILVDAGVISKQHADSMRRKWPNYVPMFREFEENEDIDFGDSLKPQMGSTRNVVNPLESLIRNAYKYVKDAEKNKAKLLLANIARAGGTGEYIEEIPGAGKPPLGDVIVFRENGRRKYLAADPIVVKAINNMGVESTNMFMRLIRWPSRIARACFTIINPSFAIRNVMRDVADATIYSKFGFKPWDIVQGLAHAIKQDEVFYEWMASGAAQASAIALDRDFTQSTIQKMTKTWKQRLLSPSGLLDLLQKMGEYSEYATRIAAYKRVKKELGNKAIMEAALESRDLMDFARGGKASRNWNQLAIFANASIQGIDKFCRTFDIRALKSGDKEAMKQFANACLRLALTAILPAIVLALVHRDDDWYQELPDWLKETHWVLGKVGNEVIRIPKGQDIGIRLFSNFVDKALSRNGKMDAKLLHPLLEMLPDIMFTAFLPIVENTANYSFFSGAPVVPGYLQHLPAEAQYNNQTSLIPRYIGEKTGLSPMKIEHALYGYTGNIGRTPMQLVDFMGRDNKSLSHEASDYPIVSGVTYMPYKNPQTVTNFYDEYDKQQRYHNLANQGVKRTEYNEAYYKRLNKAHNEITKLNQQERKIVNDTKLDINKRYDLQRGIQQKRIAIAKSALRK